MTSEATKLLPCPFCGSDAAEPWFDEDAGWGEVYCAKCSASTQGNHQGWVADDDKAKSILEAIVAWNTRDTTHAQAMVAAEREACAGIADYFAEVDYGLMHYPEADAIAASNTAHEIRLAIRARTPDDAQAALDALLQAEREAGRVEGLREAMQIAEQCDSLRTKMAIKAVMEKKHD